MPDGEEAVLRAYEGRCRVYARNTARRTGRDCDDIAQWARIGILKGYRTYDPRRGASLSTHLWERMQSEVRHGLRDDWTIRIPAWVQERRGRERLGQIPTLLALDAMPDDALNDLCWADEPGYAAVDEADAIRDICDCLPMALRRVLVLTYVCELSAPQVGARIGLTADGVRKRIKRAVRMVRADWARRGGIPCAV